MSARKLFCAVRRMDAVVNVRAVTVRNSVQDCRSITQFSEKLVKIKCPITGRKYPF
jgi:hypothetical protein